MELFGREGAKVVGTARREAALQEGLDKVKAHGGDGIIVPADLEDVSSADSIAQAALDTYGRIDVLVNNAGVGWQYGLDHPGTMAGIHEASLENWRDILGGVDLEGYFLMIHACLPHMIEAQTASCPAKEVLMPLTVEVRDRSVLEPVRGLTAMDFVLSGKGVIGAPVSVALGLPTDIVVLIEDRGRGGLLAGVVECDSGCVVKETGMLISPKQRDSA